MGESTTIRQIVVTDPNWPTAADWMIAEHMAALSHPATMQGSPALVDSIYFAVIMLSSKGGQKARPGTVLVL